MITVALVGAGSFAHMHLQAYAESEKAAVKWVCDPVAPAREGCTSAFRVPCQTSDYRESLKDDSVDLVDIVAPNFVHSQIAIDAMNAGKNVLCEKPMALNTGECQAMLRAARVNNRQLYVKYHQRFDDVHQAFKRMWDAGEMPGSVVTIARRMDTHLKSMLDPGHWRGIPELTGGGCLFSSGSHTLDLLEYVFGPVRAVTATNRQLLTHDPGKSDDNATVVMEFRSGMVATFVGCWTVEHVRWTTMETYSRDATIRVRSEGADLVLERETKGSVVELLRSRDWFRRSNIQAIHHFIDCASGDASPRYASSDCVRSMYTLESAYRSSDEGRRVEVAYPSDMVRTRAAGMQLE